MRCVNVCITYPNIKEVMKIVNYSMAKVQLKIGKSLLPSYYIDMNFNEERKITLMMMVAIETYTKAFLELDKKDKTYNMDLMEVKEYV
jgi:hypothetical protein